MARGEAARQSQAGSGYTHLQVNNDQSVAAGVNNGQHVEISDGTIHSDAAQQEMAGPGAGGSRGYTQLQVNSNQVNAIEGEYAEISDIAVSLS